MSGILRRRGNIYKEVLRAKCTFQDILVRRQGRFQRLSVRASTRRIGTGNRSRMQLISMNALCDNDSTLKEEESSFSGRIRPPKPSCSFPSFGCRILGSTVPVPTRLDHRSRGGIWPCVLCRPIWAGGHAIGDVFVTLRDQGCGCSKEKCYVILYKSPTCLQGGKHC